MRVKLRHHILAKDSLLNEVASSAHIRLASMAMPVKLMAIKKGLLSYDNAGVAEDIAHIVSISEFYFVLLSTLALWFCLQISESKVLHVLFFHLELVLQRLNAVMEIDLIGLNSELALLAQHLSIWALVLVLGHIQDLDLEPAFELAGHHSELAVH